jgi:hypothetical protein
MQKPRAERAEVPARTQDQMRQHYRRFVDEGSVKPKAKDVSYNVIGQPLLSIPINQVISLFSILIPLMGTHL